MSHRLMSEILPLLIVAGGTALLCGLCSLVARWIGMEPPRHEWGVRRSYDDKQVGATRVICRICQRQVDMTFPTPVCSPCPGTAHG